MEYRREFLASVGLAATAGCMGFGGESESTYRIDSIAAFNKENESHTLSVRVERDDDVLFEDTMELEPMDGNTAGGGYFEHGWPNDHARYVVRSQFDGGDWRTLAPGEAATRGDCIKIIYLADRHTEGYTTFVGSCEETTSSGR